jgi:polyhydroxyalkanoate synthesis regulator phasin
MKRIILVLTLIMAVSTTFGQNKWQQKQINHFVDSAVKEYNLSDDQKKDLTEARITVIMSYINSAEKVKNGEMTADEKKETTQKASNDFNSFLIKMTGKTYQELKPFLDRMQEEIKNLK